MLLRVMKGQKKKKRKRKTTEQNKTIKTTYVFCKHLSEVKKKTPHMKLIGWSPCSPKNWFVIMGEFIIGYGSNKKITHLSKSTFFLSNIMLP